MPRYYDGKYGYEYDEKGRIVIGYCPDCDFQVAGIRHEIMFKKLSTHRVKHSEAAPAPKSTQLTLDNGEPPF